MHAPSTSTFSHTICFSSSAASVSSSVCLSVSLSFSLSHSSLFLFLSLFAFAFSLSFFTYSAIEVKESTHPWIFSRESVCRFAFMCRCRNYHGDCTRLYRLVTKISTALFRGRPATRTVILLRIGRQGKIGGTHASRRESVALAFGYERYLRSFYGWGWLPPPRGVSFWERAKAEGSGPSMLER